MTEQGKAGLGDFDRSVEAAMELAESVRRMQERAEPERNFADELREHQVARRIYHPD